MKVADYIIQLLADKGIAKIPLVYGAACGDLVDAFTRVKNTQYVCFNHEANAGYAAEAYAKISNNFGVVIVTSGPGGQNLVTPISNCWFDSVPCLFITGQVKQQFMRPNNSIRQIGFQECPITDIVKPITKYAVCVKDPLHIQYELEKCLYVMQSGRPGPVLLDIPIDVQKADINPEELPHFKDYAGFKLEYSEEKFPLLLEDIKNAKRPCLLIGGGAVNAKDLIHQLSKKLYIPCLRTWNGKDIIPNDFLLFGGDVGTYAGLGRCFAVQNCDLLICIGTRISGRITGGNPSSFSRGAKKWLIDIDESNILSCESQGVKIDDYIIQDSKIFCQGFMEYLDRFKENIISFNDNWVSKVIEWRDKYDPVFLHPIDPSYQYVNPYHFIRELSNQCDKNTIITSECGGNRVIFNHAFKTKNGQRSISNDGNSCMGQGLGLGIGACLANPEKSVVCIVGDGGFSISIPELQTIRNYAINNLKIIVLNNEAYGITRAFQRDNFNGREEACCPRTGYSPPDFGKVAEAYGIEYMCLENNEEIVHGVSHLLSSDNAIICDVNCKDWMSYFPKITGWAQSIEDMNPQLSNEEFLSNMLIPITEVSKKNRKL